MKSRNWSYWRPWFAWRPVRVRDTGQLVWLEWVERLYDYTYHLNVYRLPR